MHNEGDNINNKRGYLNEDFQIFHLKDQKNMEFEFHYHEFNKITILISGNATYLIEGKVYKLKPWDILFVNSNEIHKVMVDSKMPYERIIIWVNSSFLDQHNVDGSDLTTCFNLTEAKKNNLLRLNPDQLKVIRHLLTQIEESYKSSDFGSVVLKNALFIQFMVYINRMLLVEGSNGGFDIEYDENINNILSYINENISSELSIDNIAERFYLSKYYLMHKFKKQTGYTIHNYIIKKRLLMANSLIKKGMPILDASSEAGFEDYSNFLRAYKKMFRTTPKKYFLETKDQSFNSFIT